MWGRPEVIAHRGASAYAPEHSFAAFDLALELGADALELDLRLTADGRLAVLHDPTLARTTGDPRPVGRVLSGDLRGLDPETRPPLLDDVLLRYGDATRYLLELKEPTVGAAAELVASVRRAALTHRVAVQSFHPVALWHVRRLEPELPVAPLLAAVPGPDRVDALLDAVRGCAGAVGVPVEGVSRGLVRAAHLRGLAVRAYTVNQPAQIAVAVAAGVDALITDVPGRALAAVTPLPVAA